MLVSDGKRWLCPCDSVSRGRLLLIAGLLLEGAFEQHHDGLRAGDAHAVARMEFFGVGVYPINQLRREIQRGALTRLTHVFASNAAGMPIADVYWQCWLVMDARTTPSRNATGAARNVTLGACSENQSEDEEGGWLTPKRGGRLTKVANNSGG